MLPESFLLFGANLALFALVLLQWWGVRRPERAPDRASRVVLIFFAALQGASVIWAIARSGPFSLAHPSLAAMLVTWVSVPLCFLLNKRAAAATSVSLAFIIHSYALVLGPALPQISLTISPFAESPWYLLHVLCALLATSAYLCAGGSAIIYLGTATVPSLAPAAAGATISETEQPTWRALRVALPSLIGSMFAYTLWTYLAWGSYRSWRPAGICLLILCLTTATTLQIGATTRWQGITHASLTLVGLILALLSIPLLSQGLALLW